MRLAHTMHKDGCANIVDTDDGERVVGYSEREPFPLGGYIFTISDLNWKRVYKGNSMASGLAELAAHLSPSASPSA